jgi:hypothetical protein
LLSSGSHAAAMASPAPHVSAPQALARAATALVLLAPEQALVMAGLTPEASNGQTLGPATFPA